jgi:uncharacterized Zn finger protein
MRDCVASAAEASTLRAVLAEKGAITAKDVFEAAERDQDTVACSIVDEVGLFLKHCTDCGTVWRDLVVIISPVGLSLGKSSKHKTVWTHICQWSKY